jgi:hypothetical protein
MQFTKQYNGAGHPPALWHEISSDPSPTAPTCVILSDQATQLAHDIDAAASFAT